MHDTVCELIVNAQLPVNVGSGAGCPLGPGKSLHGEGLPQVWQDV